MLNALLLAIVVVLPGEPGSLTWRELSRLQPEAQLRAHDGKTVTRGPEDVVVIFAERAPEEVRARGFATAASDRERRLSWVFLADLERYTGLDRHRDRPLFSIAVGRVVAHEVEHHRRGGPLGVAQEHDPDGFFKAVMTPAELTALGWGKWRAPRAADLR